MSEDTLTAIFRAVDEITPVVKSIEGQVSKGMATIKNSIVAAFSVAAVKSMITSTLDLTGKLSDLSGKTGITAESLQVMNQVMGPSGVSLEQIARGASTLANNLVGGNKSAVAAVQALGLNTKDLIAMGPEKAFLAIGESVAKIPNPMEKSALATAIFGKSGAEFLPAFTTDMTALGEAVRESGNILSEELVAAGDEAGDALTRLETSGSVLLGKLILPMAPALTTLAGWLGDLLPRALGYAQDAFNGLIRVFMVVNSTIIDLGLKMSEMSRDIPLFGRVFGSSAEEVGALQRASQLAKDTITAFDQEALKPVKKTTQELIPITTTFTEAVASSGRAAKKAADEGIGVLWGDLNDFGHIAVRYNLEIAPDFQTQTDGMSEAMLQLAEMIARANGEVIQFGNELQNTMLPIWAEFPKAVTQDTATVRSGMRIFFEDVLGGAEHVGSSITSIFSAAFVGGGGALGAVQSFATQALSSLMGMIPLIGPFIAGFAGPIVAMLGNMGRRVADFFRDVFGGPSRDELNGRKLVAEFEANLSKMLDETGRLEPGMESWEATVVAIRDAYIAVGLTEQQALDDAARLWASSREGAEASRRVIAEIEARMRGAGTEAVTALDAITDAIERIPTEREINIRVHRDEEVEESDGHAVGTMGRYGSWFHDFGPVTRTTLHGNEAVVTPAQAPAFAAAMGGGDSGALRELIRMHRDLPRAVSRSVADALVLAGVGR